MSKVSLTVWYHQGSPHADSVFQTIQETDMNADECSEQLIDLDTKAFAFGKAVIYTEGVRAFVFEDVDA